MPVDGGGDPYITPIEGQPYEMQCISGHRYNLLTAGEVKAYARGLAVPGLPTEHARSCFVGVDLYLPDSARLTLRPDQTLVVEGGGWTFRVTRKLCRLSPEGHAAGPVADAKDHVYEIPGGPCHVYVGLHDDIHAFGPEGTHLRIARDGCALDGPGHFGRTQDAWHPLMNVPHVNWHIDHPADLGDATGLAVKSLPPDTDWEAFAVEG